MSAFQVNDSLPISSVERETGLSKDTLRVWERRYGFPTPLRNSNGERLYPLPQIARLQRIKRLMDQGHRPGKLLDLNDEQMEALDNEVREIRSNFPTSPKVDAWINAVKNHDNTEIQRLFINAVALAGIAQFIQETIAPVLKEVGEAWARGDIGIFEEHLFSENLQTLIRKALSGLVNTQGTPRILLTTLPGEEHTLGLLMVESVLAVGGAYPINLGAQTPTLEIVRAANAKQADIVCLSFSAAYPTTRALEAIAQLRQQLPINREIWAGGGSLARARPPLGGVCFTPQLIDLERCLKDWRLAHQPRHTDD